MAGQSPPQSTRPEHTPLLEGTSPPCPALPCPSLSLKTHSVFLEMHSGPRVIFFRAERAISAPLHRYVKM